jgi:hypothetical protein
MFSSSCSAESSFTTQSQKRRLTTSNCPWYCSGMGLKQSTMSKSTFPLQLGGGNCLPDKSKAFTVAVSGSSADSSDAQILQRGTSALPPFSGFNQPSTYPVPAPKSTTLTLERLISILGCNGCFVIRESQKWLRFSLRFPSVAAHEVGHVDLPH